MKTVAAGALVGMFITGCMESEYDLASNGNALLAGGGEPQLLRVDNGRADRAFAVTSDALGNVYVAGSIENGSLRSHFAVIKYDARGSRVWTAFHGGAAGGPAGEAHAVAVDAAGNVFAVGFARTTVGVSSTVRGVVVKFSPGGAERWARVLDGARPELVAVDPTGSVVISGVASGFDFLTQKYTTDGVLSWDRRFDGGATNDILRAMQLDRAGNVVVTGWVESPGALRGATDVATLKYDALGDVLWTRVFTASAASHEQPGGLALDDAGNVYVTGSTTADTSGELPVETQLLKYDAGGTLQFVKTGAELGGRAVVVDAAGDVVVGGDFPAVVSRLDPSGVLLWSTPVSAATDLAVNAAGEIFVSGGAYVTTQLAADGVVLDEHRLAGPANFRDAVADLHLDAAGNLYVTGTRFGSIVSASADIVTLKFAPDAPAALPAAPSDLAATAPASAVSLSWRDHAADERGFRVERCAGQGCTGFAAIADVGANVTSFDDAGLAPGGRFRYRVRAFNDAGVSAASNVVGVRIPRR